MSELLMLLILALLVIAFVWFLRQRDRVMKEVENLRSRLTAVETEMRGKDKTPGQAPFVAPGPPPIVTTPVTVMRSTPLSSPVMPPPLPQRTIPPELPRMPVTPATASKGVQWEALMGAKLFAWLGGFALFLGIVFLVKYSFEHNLIAPPVRVAMGYLIGLGLIVGGWMAAQRRYRTPALSLCATGVLILYAATYAAHDFYQLIPLSVAFVVMTMVTVIAFYLAVRLDAQVIVVLGLLGGFLTPILLGSGRDNVFALFGYVAILNAGVTAVALRKRWELLIALAALATIAVELVWAARFFHVRRLPVGMSVFLGAEALFLGAALLWRQRYRENVWTTVAVVLTGSCALGFLFLLADSRELAAAPLLLFSWLFLADVGLVAMAIIARRNDLLAASGCATFALLVHWTTSALAPSLFLAGAIAYLIFAALHGGFVPLARSEGRQAIRVHWLQAIALVLVALVVLGRPQESVKFTAWISLLLFIAVTLGFARSRAGLWITGALFVFVLVLSAAWTSGTSINLTSVGRFAANFSGWALFLLPASVFTGRAVRDSIQTDKLSANGAPLGSTMPFMLLLFAVGRLAEAPITQTFSLLFVLAAAMLALAVARQRSWPAVIALTGTWIVETAWHALHFNQAPPVLTLGWYLVLLFLFAAFPFFHSIKEDVLSWAVSAIATAMQFWLVYLAAKVAFPAFPPLLLPALFALLPAAGVFYLLKKCRADPTTGDARLAWQAAATLLFVSLIFPIGFDREWITLGWAVEGLALLLLYRKLPNRALRYVGVGLLMVAFVRLALNPAVHSYHARTAIPLWNWYLYAYGITSLCLILAARTFGRETIQPPDRLLRRLLYICAGILLFLLLNIEIADYFSIGPTLTFAFTGNFARDMTYSVAWALFALGLIVLGIKRRWRVARYAALGLFALTLAKLFLHDLSNLSQLYRIVAFITVAVILIVVSFVYQRFLSDAERTS